MSTSPHIVARDTLLAAWRDALVATAARIDHATWITRVLQGDRDGYIGELHRGRLPAVELYQISDVWQAPAYDAGTLEAVWGIRIHVGDLDQNVAEEAARQIAYTGLSRVRATNYFKIGQDRVTRFEPSPLGHQLELEITVSLAMTQTDYETTTDDSGAATPPDGGTVGGIRTTVSWNTTSPVAVLALPSGQALALVQVRVVTPFDGTGAAVSIGTDAGPEDYLAEADTDITAAAETVFEKDADDSGPLTVKVFVTPGTGATQGQLSIQLIATGDN